MVGDDEEIPDEEFMDISQKEYFDRLTKKVAMLELGS